MEFLLWVTVVVLAVALGYVVGRRQVVERVIHHTESVSPPQMTTVVSSGVRPIAPDPILSVPVPKMVWVQLEDQRGNAVARYEMVDRFRRSTIRYRMGDKSTGTFAASTQDADGTWIYRQVGSEKPAS